MSLSLIEEPEQALGIEMDELDRSHYTMHAYAHCKGTGDVHPILSVT
jgi:hypothetical protein